ncbi:hypothetical protein NEIRO02_0621 [Nematocida sp. AWRm79]|nr:hypothetical protein NEIRO02_0621 [Nematocida sp. AWRm79]
MSKSLREKQLEEDTDATSQPSRKYNRGDHGPPGDVGAVLRRMDLRKGRGPVEQALSLLATSPYTWTDWSAHAKLMHWLFEIGSRPESETGDIAIESQAQVTRMDKLPEDWTNEDWKEFIEYMLDYIENEKQSVLVKPPRIQDFCAMRAQQYQIWAAMFITYIEEHRYTHQQILTDIIRFPMNYPPEIKALWTSTEGDLNTARKELRKLCKLIDTQWAETRAAMGRRPEEQRGRNQKRRDTRDSRQKFTGSCNYCHKIGHKEVACRKKVWDAQRPSKGSLNKTAPNS